MPKLIKLVHDIKYHKTKDWYDDMTMFSIGTSFIFRINNPNDKGLGDFFYYVDLHTPMINLLGSRAHIKNLTAVWASGGGIIMADTDEGLNYWTEILKNIDATTKKPVYSHGGKSLTLDVEFEKEEAKDIVHTLRVIESEVGAAQEEVDAYLDENFDEFYADFLEHAAKVVKMSQIRYILGNKPPESIIRMIPTVDVRSAYGRFVKILAMAEEEKEEEGEDLTPEPTASEELDLLAGPTEEELVGIEEAPPPPEEEIL